MGRFGVQLTLRSDDGTRSETVEAVADSGSAYTVLPRATLESLGCVPVRPQLVGFADGRTEEWFLTLVAVECAGRRAITPVLMNPGGGPLLLGATTLQELGLGVDPVHHRLIPVTIVQV
jgi:predicted aspartyl protease